MAENIVTAGVNVNIAGRTSGSPSKSNNSDSLLKSILGEMKLNNRILDVAQKKALSGFGGAGSSLISAITNPIIAAIGGFVGLTAVAGSVEKPEGSFSYFTKALVDGEEKVLKMDQLTGQVVDVLTFREAIERGVMDETGKIKSKYQQTTNSIEKNISSLSKQRDYLILSEGYLDDIASEQLKQKLYDEDITRSKKIIAEKLAKEASRAGEISSSGPVKVPNNVFRTTDYNGNSIGFGPGIQESEQSRKVDDTLRIINSNSQSSGNVYLDLLAKNLFGRK
jgi:hypothetical protein